VTGTVANGRLTAVDQGPAPRRPHFADLTPLHPHQRLPGRVGADVVMLLDSLTRRAQAVEAYHQRLRATRGNADFLRGFARPLNAPAA
jgi:transcription termination factor Rho